MIIDLLSPRTALVDRTTKKDVYEQVFHTAEYYCYDPITQQLEGWQLHCGRYQPLTPDAQGWLWCDRLQRWLGTWNGSYITRQATWLRFYDAQGQVVPVFAEAAQQQAKVAQQQAETEHQRAETAETELAQLRARLAQLEGQSEA